MSEPATVTSIDVIHFFCLLQIRIRTYKYSVRMDYQDDKSQKFPLFMIDNFLSIRSYEVLYTKIALAIYEYYLNRFFNC